VAHSVPRVVRRGDTFYFRMGVPLRIQQRVGQRELKLSLRTSDPMAARVRGRMLSNAIDILFEELPRMAKLTTPEIQNRIRNYFQSCLNRSLERTLDFAQDPGVDVSAEITYLRQKVEALRARLSAQAFDDDILDAARGVVEPGGATGQPLTPDVLSQASIGVMRAEIENARVLAAMLAGEYEQTAPRDQLFAGMAPTGAFPYGGEPELPKVQEPTIAAVADLYCEHHEKNWVEKTAKDQRRVLNLIIAIMGGDKPIRDLGIENVKRVRDALAQLPPNYMKAKANKEKSVVEAIEQNKDGAALSKKTQQKYLEMFRQMLKWAVNEGYLDKVPGQGVKIAGVAKGNAAEDRDPYSAEQLQAILASPLYRGHHEKRRHEPGKFITRDGYFWAFLIALYSGMRMNEILQLTVSDIKQEGEIWYFNVTEGEDQSLKTKGSKRRIPIHEALLQIGLLNLLKEKPKTQRLFPEIEKGTDGRYSTNFSKWWGRYSKLVGFKEAKTAFHSTRHNFKDALNEAEVSEAIAKSLMGHVDASVHAQYGKGPSLKMLKAAIDKVQFPIELPLTVA
jgi:integrase